MKKKEVETQMRKEIQEMVEVILDKKVDVVAIKDVTSMGTFADTFIVAVADNARQLQAVVNEFRTFKHDDKIYVEGEGADGWIAIQKNDVCVHLFSFEEHERYRLDELYKDQPTIENIF